MRYTVCYGTQRQPGLLFETLDLEKVAALPELPEIFPKGYFVTQVGERNPEPRRWSYSYQNAQDTTSETKYCVLVSTTINAPDPDKAELGAAPVKVFFNGTSHTVNLRTRYNQCLSFFKAVGCAKCPSRGMACLSEGVGVELPERLSPAHEVEDLWDHMREKYASWGGFTLIKPGSTRTDNFSATFRPYWEHDFEAVEKNFKKRSAASQGAAETKKFKKTQCSKCLISSVCDQAKWCLGAYPPEEEIIKDSAQKLDDAFAKSAWPAWQLWEVARAVGAEAKFSRWKLILTGIKLQGTDGIVATVHRSRGGGNAFGKLKTYEEIANVFGLALKEEDVHARKSVVESQKIKAILWLTLTTGTGRQYYGWGCSRHTIGAGANDHHVSVLWTNGNHISGYTTDMTELKQVAGYLSNGSALGDVQQIRVR